MGLNVGRLFVEVNDIIIRWILICIGNDSYVFRTVNNVTIFVNASSFNQCDFLVEIILDFKWDTSPFTSGRELAEWLELFMK